MPTERRYIDIKAAGVAIEQRTEGEPATIVGYAAVFYRASDPGTEYKFAGFWDDFTERIMPTAFDDALKSDDVRALFNHDPNHILGRSTSGTLKLTVDATGLRYEIAPPDTAMARDLVESIRRGDISGSSFSFIPEELQWREQKGPDDKTIVIREVVRAKLFDVGPVTFPAYESTTTGVRAASDLTEAKSSYEAWKASAANLAAFHRDITRTTARLLEIKNSH